MKRIDTSTVEVDKHGTGRDGFTNGDPGVPTPATQLDETWFDHTQEELCRAVENDGATLDDDNFNQLDDAIQHAAVRGVCADPTADYILRGLTFTVNGASLSIALAAGEFVQNGRRYVITAAKLAASGDDTHTLTASRDTYFYIARDNPGSIAPSQETVHVEQSAVANGASAPSTPAGTLLFAMVVSDGTGSTFVTYFNRGPSIVDEGGATIRLRPALGVGAARPALLRGEGQTIDIGVHAGESNDGYWRDIHVERTHIRTTASSLQSYLDNFEFTAIAATSAGGSTDVNLLDAASYPDGSAAHVEVRIVGIDPSDPTDGYSARIECHVHQDGGTTWTLDGSGGTPSFVDGNGAIAAGVAVAFNVSGSQLRLGITGHGTDAMRWALAVRVLISGDS